MYKVALQECIEKMNLECLTPDVNIEEIEITQSDVNRPALQLAGFFDYFDHHRVQIIGHVENTYMENQGMEYSVEMMGRIMSYKVPCIVFCRNIQVPEEFLAQANEHGVPILRTKMTTSSFSSELDRWLKVELAPRIRIHGVLVDIYGEGVLITGESGIGKSEVALELIHRGHRLVSDDEAGCPERAKLPFQKAILEEKLPFTIGGGIGQSRICMFFLRKAHIGEVQSSLWKDEVVKEAEKHGIPLL